MILTATEKFTFKFLARFYFYLWPFAISWNENYTALYLSQHTLRQKRFYYIWVFAMFAYCTVGVCELLFYNKYTGKTAIPWMNAAIIVATILFPSFVWFLVYVVKTLVEGLNQVLLLLAKFNEGTPL